MSGVGGTTKRDTEIRLPRATKVKNKQPAAQQARQCRIFMLWALVHFRALPHHVAASGRRLVRVGVPTPLHPVARGMLSQTLRLSRLLPVNCALALGS